jgi:hypothetical protein
VPWGPQGTVGAVMRANTPDGNVPQGKAGRECLKILAIGTCENCSNLSIN